MRHKILFISSWFPNELEPTNGNFVQRHAEAVSLLHDVEVLHTMGDFNQKKTYIFDEKQINNVKTLIVYYKNSKNPAKNFYRRMKSYHLGFQKMQKPDLVHANVLHNSMLFAVYLKNKFKIPFVVTEHWTALQEENIHKTSKKILKIAKFIGNRASYILPVSQNLLQSIKKLGISTKMQVVSNVVDTELFKLNNPEHLKKRLFKFLHVSSLVPRKKADKIIKVGKKLLDDGYDFTLEIGGDGDVESLNKLISELETTKNMTTFGAISYADVAEKMKSSDCFILFSENETQGCVILESLACGVPVIASKVGGVPEFVPKNSGILIAKNDEEALYLAMKNVIEGSIPFETPENLRSNVVKNHSKESIANQFSGIYHHVLKS